MLNFTIQLQSGIPIYEQIVYAVKKAVVSGQLKKGDTFPSVREIAKELRINPNTAQKVIAQLVREGLLEIKPGIGSVVASIGIATDVQKEKILCSEIEKLVVECKRLSITKEDVLKAVEHNWKLDK